MELPDTILIVGGGVFGCKLPVSRHNGSASVQLYCWLASCGIHQMFPCLASLKRNIDRLLRVCSQPIIHVSFARMLGSAIVYTPRL